MFTFLSGQLLYEILKKTSTIFHLKQKIKQESNIYLQVSVKSCNGATRWDTKVKEERVMNLEFPIFNWLPSEVVCRRLTGVHWLLRLLDAHHVNCPTPRTRLQRQTWRTTCVIDGNFKSAKLLRKDILHLINLRKAMKAHPFVTYENIWDSSLEIKDIYMLPSVKT